MREEGGDEGETFPASVAAERAAMVAETAEKRGVSKGRVKLWGNEVGLETASYVAFVFAGHLLL